MLEPSDWPPAEKWLTAEAFQARKREAMGAFHRAEPGFKSVTVNVRWDIWATELLINGELDCCVSHDDLRKAGIPT